MQAIKFEHIVEKGNQSYDSSLVEFLIHRAIRNPILGNYFHWYLMVECEDKLVGKMYAKVAYHYFKAILEVLMFRISLPGYIIYCNIGSTGSSTARHLTPTRGIDSGSVKTVTGDSRHEGC